MKGLKKKFINLKLVLKAKIATYKIRFILLKQLINQRWQDNPVLKDYRERLDFWWFRGMSKPDNALAVTYLLFPFYFMILAAPKVKKFCSFWFSYIYYEIWYIFVDIYCGIKKTVMFPFNIYKIINNFVNIPWNGKKILRVLKVPISIRLYLLFKKHIWMPIWIRLDYDWFCYVLSLYLVNYNYLLMEREKRWFSYDHQPASWDYDWLTMFH